MFKCLIKIKNLKFLNVFVIPLSLLSLEFPRSVLYTREEERILKQCEKDSLLYRSIPFICVSLLINKRLFRKGIIKPHKDFGTKPVFGVGILFAYWLGKYSYVDTCAELLMQLPEGALAKNLRDYYKRPLPFVDKHLHTERVLDEEDDIEAVKIKTKNKKYLAEEEEIYKKIIERVAEAEQVRATTDIPEDTDYSIEDPPIPWIKRFYNYFEKFEYGGESRKRLHKDRDEFGRIIEKKEYHEYEEDIEEKENYFERFTDHLFEAF